MFIVNFVRLKMLTLWIKLLVEIIFFSSLIFQLFIFLKKANFKLKKDADSENEDAVDDEEARDSFDDYIMTKENLAYFGKMVMPYFKVLPRPTFL